MGIHMFMKLFHIDTNIRMIKMNIIDISTTREITLSLITIIMCMSS